MNISEELRISVLNDIIQNARTRRDLWQITQHCSLRELRAVCDLNGHDAEDMTQADCLNAIKDDKGF